MRRSMILAAPALLAGAVPATARTPEQVAEAALRTAPVWDGHNDVPEQLRERRKDLIADFDFRDTTGTADPAHDRIAMHTDLARLRKGHVGAQFWSVWVSTSARIAALRSETATRTWPCPMSTPATPPGRTASATRRGGRPLPPLYGVPRSSVSITLPFSSSSPTRLETVVRDNPDPRARSARLWGPPEPRSAVIARRLELRSWARECPGTRAA